MPPVAEEVNGTTTRIDQHRYLAKLIMAGDETKEYIEEHVFKEDVDPLVYLLTEIYDFIDQDHLPQSPGWNQFMEQTKILTEKFLAEDADSKYRWRVFTDQNEREMSLLHIVAERDLVCIAKVLVDKYPNLMYLKTECNQTNDDGSCSGRGNLLPVELALKSNSGEDVSAFLISCMSDIRVKNLLQGEGNGTYVRMNDYVESFNTKDEPAILDVSADGSFSEVQEKFLTLKEKLAKKLKTKLDCVVNGRRGSVTSTEPPIIPKVRTGVIIHTESGQWKTAVALKDLLCTEMGEFLHMRDVRKCSGGETFEEQLRKAVTTCTTLLLICSPSSTESVKKEEVISISIPSKLSLDFSSAILGKHTGKTVRIVQNVTKSSENMDDEEDGPSCKTIHFKLGSDEKLSHKLLKQQEIDEQIFNFVQKNVVNNPDNFAFAH